VTSDSIVALPDNGKVIMEDTMLVLAGISPMTIPLQDPVTIWRPLVSVFPTQVLMKLLVEVNDFACPTSAAPIEVLPSTKEPLWIASGERTVESARLLSVRATPCTCLISWLCECIDLASRRPADARRTSNVGAIMMMVFGSKYFEGS